MVNLRAIVHHRYIPTALIVILITISALCQRLVYSAHLSSFRAPAAARRATFTVNDLRDLPDDTPGDGVCDATSGTGVCTLRAAIQEANALGGPNTINFSVSGTITLGSPLPDITTQLTITGTVSGPLNQPQVRIDANNLAIGISFTSTATSSSSMSQITGMAIRNADATPDGTGIRIRPAAPPALPVTGIVIAGCWIGIDDAGTSGGQANANDIGILINGSTNNLIGGTTAAARNVISNNGLEGITLQAAANNNQILGNYIGISPDGTVRLRNNFGITIFSTGNTIGSVGGGRNVISGNSDDGITINLASGAGNNTIAGNYIGLAPDGTTPMPNTADGIFIGVPTAESNTIGPGNVISSNDGDGIQLDLGASNNKIIGNIIGLDAAGVLDRGNGQSGIQVGANSSSGNNNANGNTIGGTTAADRNIISGNGSEGILVQEASSNNLIIGNYIGTNAAGTAAVGNTGHGILLDPDSGTGNNIGSSDAGSGNVISGNTEDGIRILSSISLNMFIKRNLIGLAAGGTNTATSGIPNGAIGIHIMEGATEVTIGRSEGGASPSGDGNIIAFNGNNGIALNNTGNARVLISENSTFNNGAISIDLGNNGVTANNTDSTTLSGPNGFQNFPVITSAKTGSITIQGTLNSVGGTVFTLEFFTDSACDPTGFGGGQFFIGSTNVTTDGGGSATFNVTFPVTPPGTVVTATATRAVAGAEDITSEFSACQTILVGQGTAVDFQAFAAHSYDNGVALDWRTGFETANLGFNLYRESGGRRERLNDSPIAGSALMIGGQAKLLSGNSYHWWDERRGGAGSSYWVESIDLDGTREWHGPFTVQPGMGPQTRVRSLPRTVMLSEINSAAAPADGSHTVEPVAQFPALDSPLRARQQQIAANFAVKIGVARAGWYRLTQPALVSAGLPSGTDPRMLQLYVDGQQVPISVTGELDGRFDASDAIEFFGLPLDAASTDTRIHWLVVGNEPGRRIAQISLDGGMAAPSSYQAAVERDDRTVYFSSLLNGDAGNFFGALVRNSPTEQLLTLTRVDQAAGAQAELDVALQGVTLQPHQVKVSLNGTAITNLEFSGTASGSAKVQVAPNLLREGQNSVSLEAGMGASDLSLVDHVRLTYFRRFVADSNRLFASVPGGARVKIGGFTANDIRVFDISDPNAVIELGGVVTGTDGAFEIAVSAAAGGTRSLFALSNAKIETAALLKANPRPELRRSPGRGDIFGGRGDLYIVTDASLADALRPLIEQRRRGGWRVVTVDVEDIFDQYSFGHRTPDAIREWLRATVNQDRGLSYLLLVGDGTYDPRNYLGFGAPDLVPVKLVDTAIAETASDDWFADFDGDGLAEMAVGRLPAGTAAEASAMVAKILAWESGSAGDGAVLVSDVNDTFDFLGTSNRIKSLLPTSTPVDMIIAGQTADVHTSLLESLNKGPRLVNYAGHGSVDLWRGSLLTSADALALTSDGRVGVYLMMTCLNGYYDAPNLESLGESLLKAPGGAVAVWASSGFTAPVAQNDLDAAMVSALYAGREITLGLAIHIAKTAVRDADIRRTWILLGDPTMVYKK